MKRILGLLILILGFSATAHSQGFILRYQNSTTTLGQVAGGTTTIRCDGTSISCTFAGGIFTVTAIGAGSGTVTSSGSPVAGNIAKFTTATNIAPAASSDILAACTTCAPLASPALTGTPAIAAATGTSLIVTGILDGLTPVTATTGSSATLGAGAYQSGYTFNQEATVATGVNYTLPPTVKGMQYCVRNSIVSGTGAADTGVLTVYPAASSYVILNGTINTIGGGGTHGVASGGAAGDSACFVAVDATHWEVFVIKGVWTAN